jgi:hypothetical protein
MSTAAASDEEGAGKGITLSAAQVVPLFFYHAAFWRNASRCGVRSTRPRFPDTARAALGLGVRLC